MFYMQDWPRAPGTDRYGEQPGLGSDPSRVTCLSTHLSSTSDEPDESTNLTPVSTGNLTKRASGLSNDDAVSQGL